MRAQGLINMVDHVHVGGIVEVPQVQQALAFRHALFGERGGAHLLIEGVIDFLDQFGDDLIHAVILVGGFLGGAGNDQRGARFVDEDGVDFVNHAKVVAALDAILQIVLHVVAEVVEAELVVGAEGDVGGISRAALRVIEVVHDHAHREAQHFVKRAHPFGVAPGQVVVDGDDVDALAGERVEIGRKGRD